MAYADTNTNPRKLGAGAAVLALEGALAWALIAGLAYTATPKDEHRLDTFNVPAITPEPAPPPKPTPDHRTIDAPVVVPSPSVAITIRDPFTYASSEPSSGEETTGAISDVSFKTPEPTVTASAKPLFTPKGAKPKNDSSRWLTTDDYPTRGLLNQLEGPNQLPAERRCQWQSNRLCDRRIKRPPGAG